MSVSQQKAGLELPKSLETQLLTFRRRVWLVKSIESVCCGLFGFVLSYLIVFALDRFVDTPNWIRAGIFLIAIGSCALIPISLHHWIWRHRRTDQLARLLCRRFPSLGDQLLGIIELVRNDFEQHRSRALCEAAIQQVSAAAQKKDFQEAVPNPRHGLWMWLAGVPLICTLAALGLVPSAATNAWGRFLAPWKSIDRYTFTSVQPLGQRLIIPHGEAVTIPVKLAEKSAWQPTRGTAQLGTQSPVISELQNGEYQFQFPAQISKVALELKIGDALQRTRVEPMLRPELKHVAATVMLPEYLQRTAASQKDIRSGTLTVVKGATATLTASANRKLVEGKWEYPVISNDDSEQVLSTRVAVDSDAVSSPAIRIDSSKEVRLEWTDEVGLSGKEPLTIRVNARDDEAPSLVCEDLPRNKIVIDSETLNFKVRVLDDFGIKVVGMEWHGMQKAVVQKLAHGERILAAGGTDKDTLELKGTFCAKNLNIEPQPISVRIFAEDYLPGRGRSYSQPFELYVMNAEQHAIWVTEQMNKWHRLALDVRDREIQLHHTNQELRLLSAEELDQADNRRRIEVQASAERANGHRLTGLVKGGEDLVQQAMRNPDFGVGHLEKWAETLQILKDISGNRMPSVADLLKQSSTAPAAAAQANSSQPNGPQAGRSQTSIEASPANSTESPKRPPVPTLTDAESSQFSADNSNEGENQAGKKPSSPRLGLAVTTIPGAAPKKKGDTKSSQETLDDAVKVQQDLLAEFDKIADELNDILANLEGSTLVKRLKAASRKQYLISGKISDQINGSFGLIDPAARALKESFEGLSKQESETSQELSLIMDDMQSYLERRQLQRYRTVLDEMKSQDVVGSLRTLGDDIPKEAGISIAQAEFWSDTFDRWADDLVDPACSGKCPGCKSRASLPPSIVLEALQILEAEVNLREETRVAEQARPALGAVEFSELANGLSVTQDNLSERVQKLNQRIKELPDAFVEFLKEIRLLDDVKEVMDSAIEILARPDTGSQAIGAETEAIELLLKSKKINPKSGGGGGSSPGGGGTGTTSDVALAMVGSGVNEKEVREDRAISQATGDLGTSLPEEFRAGLDEYFNRLEKPVEKSSK